MPEKKKSPLEMTCAVSDKIHNGQGGCLREGTKFEAADKAAYEVLKDKGWAK